MANGGDAALDGAEYSPYVRHSWLSFRLTGSSVAAPHSFFMESRAHAISFVLQGSHSVRWMTRGHETRWSAKAGALTLTPCDGEEHTFVTAMPPGFETAIIFIPDGHFRGALASEGVEGEAEFRRLLVHDDAVLKACMMRLAVGSDGTDDATDLRKDEAARALLLRLVQLDSGVVPDWHGDDSTFDRRTVKYLVSYVDAHLHTQPSLSDMACLVGLSPSHFAKKFRQSMGLSLQRFVNRRRLFAAMELLKDQSQPLAHVALDLGFSAQSHFTHVFSELTGMTPAKYRKQFRRTVG